MIQLHVHLWGGEGPTGLPEKGTVFSDSWNR